MAEDDEDAGAGGGDIGEFLTRKIGPLQLWVYVLIFAGFWLYLERRNRTAAAAGASTSTGSNGSSYGTDPAGNTGVIDPRTGYVAGSAEDTAALEQLSGSGASGGAATYSTNQEWESAAINYLVGLGEDPVVANSAIAAYLGSQTLTTTQQAMVNQCIQALGAPPQPPSPASGTTIVSPPGGSTTYAVNPPSGLAVTHTSAGSITAKWNPAANATGYKITAAPGGSTQGSISITSRTPNATVTGLASSTSYKITVQATPADTGAPSATTTASTTGLLQGGSPTRGAGGAVASAGT